MRGFSNDRLVTNKNFAEVLKYLDQAEDNLIAFDIEADSGRPEIAQCIGFAFTHELDNGYYIITHQYDKEVGKLLEIPGQVELARKLLVELMKYDLIMHNGVYDIVTIWRNYGIDLTDAFLADTILMKHTLDENTNHGLEACVNQFQEEIRQVGEKTLVKKVDILHESIKKNGGKISQKIYELYKADPLVIAEYAIADVYLTLRLFHLFEGMLEETNQLDFFYNLEVMPTNKWAIIPMRMYGIPVNRQYFLDLEKELTEKIEELKNDFYIEVSEDIKAREDENITKTVKAKKGGDFAKYVLKHVGIPVPTTKQGKETLNKNALQALKTQYDHPAVSWLLGDTPSNIITDKKGKIIEELPPLKEEDISAIKRKIWEDKHPDKRPFNIGSKEDLAWLIFDFYKEEINPDKLSSKTGKPQVDKEVLNSFSHLPFISKILEIRKEEKILGTYVKGILEMSGDGNIYPSFLQFGTTSGRFSCKNPNFQNLPARDTRIKAGLQAPKGYKIVNADYSSLEPRIFSWVCQDPGLIKVWQEERDLYSYLAIKVLSKMSNVSVPPEATDNPNDDTYLKKIAGDIRDKSKTFTLSVPYGANAFNIAMVNGWDVPTSQELIDNYLNEVPGLADYMVDQEEKVLEEGKVETRFGRVRNLPEAKKYYEMYGEDIRNKWKMAIKTFNDKDTLNEILDDIDDLKAEARETRDKKAKDEIYKLIKQLRQDVYRGGHIGVKMYAKFKTAMNLAKNAPIQMTAAHVANSSIVKWSKSLKEHKIDGWVAGQIHDEIAGIIREDQAELAAQLLSEAMSSTYVIDQISVPILGEPAIVDTWDKAK